MRKLVLVTFSLLFFSLTQLSAQERVQEYGVVELRFSSDSIYNQPHFDLQVDGLFTAPDGEIRRVGGFWDGGTTWVVRFAPDQIGSWSWRTICSDEMNPGLHGQSGVFEVLPYRGEDPYRAKGWPQVAEGGRHLEYRDGTPFFYLGCTAWEMSWRSYSHETDRYFSDRRTKGYNAVQMVVLSHRQFQEFGVVNRNGDSSLIGWDLGMLNPEYFRYLDSLILKANDSGLMVTLVPLWAELAWIQDKGNHRFTFDREEGLSLARYVAARYGAYNVMWIVAGDSDYHKPEQKAFWADFAQTLDSVGGGNHLITLHTSGWAASWLYFDNNTPWLDFHTYHSSHLADNDYQWFGPREGYPLDPPKPIVNGEQVYEDIYNNFHPDSTRIDRKYVRQAAFESFLTGAYVGIVYGANSIWQWHNGTYAFEAHAPRVDVMEAIHFPGSRDVSMAKEILERFPWHRFEPRADLVVSKPENRYIPVSVVDSLALAYFFYDVTPARIDLSSLGDTVRLGWIDPVTGLEQTGPTFSGAVLNALPTDPPGEGDWVMIARGSTASEPLPPDTIDLVEPTDVDLQVSTGRRGVLLVGRLASDADLDLTVTDLLARSVAKRSVQSGVGALYLEIPLEFSGLYFVRVSIQEETGEKIEVSYKVFLP